MLFMVFVELLAARGVVATLGNYGIMGLSTFANNMLVLLAIAAGTDYAIFIVGRYHEARSLGETVKRRSTRCSTARRMSCWVRG